MSSQRTLLLKHLRENQPELEPLFHGLSECSKISRAVLDGDSSQEKDELACYAPLFCPEQYRRAAECLAKKEQPCTEEIASLQSCHSNFGERLMKANGRQAPAPCADALNNLERSMTADNIDEELLAKQRFDAELCVARIMCPSQLNSLKKNRDADSVRQYESCMTGSELCFIALQGILHQEN